MQHFKKIVIPTSSFFKNSIIFSLFFCVRMRFQAKKKLTLILKISRLLNSHNSSSHGNGQKCTGLDGHWGQFEEREFKYVLSDVTL